MSPFYRTLVITIEGPFADGTEPTGTLEVSVLAQASDHDAVAAALTEGRFTLAWRDTSSTLTPVAVRPRGGEVIRWPAPHRRSWTRWVTGG